MEATAYGLLLAVVVEAVLIFWLVQPRYEPIGHVGYEVMGPAGTRIDHDNDADDAAFGAVDVAATRPAEGFKPRSPDRVVTVAATSPPGGCLPPVRVYNETQGKTDVPGASPATRLGWYAWAPHNDKSRIYEVDEEKWRASVRSVPLDTLLVINNTERAEEPAELVPELLRIARDEQPERGIIGVYGTAMPSIWLNPAEWSRRYLTPGHPVRAYAHRARGHVVDRYAEQMSSLAANKDAWAMAGAITTSLYKRPPYPYLSAARQQCGYIAATGSPAAVLYWSPHEWGNSQAADVPDEEQEALVRLARGLQAMGVDTHIVIFRAAAEDWTGADQQAAERLVERATR